MPPNLLVLWHCFQGLLHEWLEAVCCGLWVVSKGAEPRLQLVEAIRLQQQLLASFFEFEYVYPAACAACIQHYVVHIGAAALAADSPAAGLEGVRKLRAIPQVASWKHEHDQHQDHNELQAGQGRKARQGSKARQQGIIC